MAFPVEEKYMVAAEQVLGRTLPADLRARLLRNNGGDVRADRDVWNLFPVFDRSDRKRIARTANHILRETAALRDWTGFPAGAIGVAANGTGDALIVRDGSDDIERWHHESGDSKVVRVDWG